MNDPGREDDGKPGRAQPLHEPTQAANARPAARSSEAEQAQLALTHLGDRHEGQPVARRAGDEVERTCGAQHLQEPLRIPGDVARREATLEKALAVGQAAKVEADGAGIDAHDARHQSAAARS